MDPLINKYKLIKEDSEKEEILGGLDAAADELSKWNAAEKTGQELVEAINTVYNNIDAVIYTLRYDKNFNAYFEKLREKYEASEEGGEALTPIEEEIYYSILGAEDNLSDEIKRMGRFIP